MKDLISLRSHTIYVTQKRHVVKELFVLISNRKSSAMNTSAVLQTKRGSIACYKRSISIKKVRVNMRQRHSKV